MYIVVGGSQGLGKEIVEVLLDRNHEVINISRSKCLISSSHLSNISLDISDLMNADVSYLFKDLEKIDGIIFSQRFRKEGVSCKSDYYIDEYKTTVIARSIIIEAYLKYQEFSGKNNVGSIILVGSTYSKSVGLDQNWSYHACKYAQEAIVNYYAVHSCGKFSINLVCPATYMKKGSEEYWNRSRKGEIWKKYPVKNLASARSIANNIVDILIGSTLLNTGNKIMLDGGVSHLYHDQEI